MARPEPAWRPPPRDGASASRVAVPAGPWATVLGFLQARFPAVAATWPQRLARGEVLDAQGRAWPADAPCPPGSLLWYWRSPPPEAAVPFEIELLHQDAQLLVVDKPHFLAVTPGGRHLQQTVLLRLQRQLGLPDLAPMHRLDLETAGVMVFICQPAQRAAYHALLRGRQVHKVYEAVAPWRDDLVLPQVLRQRLADGQGPGPGQGHFMQVQVVDGAPNAETEIALIARLAPSAGQAGALAPDGREPVALAHYRLIPHTGHRHQLRAQLNHLGLPIVGDRIYPVLWPDPALGAVPDYSNPLQLLARELAFIDPVSGQARRFASRRRLALVPQARDQ